ncbi:MAG: hypothetical protein ABF990_07360 [Acetobacter sp.]|uniref:hypothetical protein n=1 Tax=Acetobacter sp. TaxID=440 RepID=UPI0039EAED93
MFRSFMRVTSAPAIADGLLTFHLTGSLVHAASALLGHALTRLSSRQQGEFSDV